MRIMILSPPNTINPETGGSTMDNRMMPLDLVVIGTVLKEKNEIKILDALALGLSKGRIIDEVKKYSPDLVLLSPFDRCRWAEESARNIIQDLNVDNIGLIGGYNPTFIEEFMKNEKKIKFSTYGDPEYTLIEIVSNKKIENIRGLVYRSGKRIIKTKPREYLNLDELPIPDRTLLNPDSYVRFPHENKSVKSMDIVASRGCPFRCSYCLVKQLYGKKYRLRSPDNIIKEIVYLKKKYGINEFSFMDSTFTLNEKWIENLTDLIKPLNIEWQCQTRVDLVNPKILEKMKSSGCFSILYGVESLNPTLLRNIKKDIKTEQIRRAVNMTKEAGIESRLSIMFGLPGETPDIAKEMTSEIIDIDPEFVQFHSLVVFPGTDIVDDIGKKNWGKMGDNVELNKYDIVGKPFIPTGYANRKEIDNIRKDAYKRFYFRPNYIGKLLARPKTLFRYLRAFRIFIKLMRE